VAPQDSENCGRNFAKRKQLDVEFAGNSLGNDAWLLLTVINTLLGGLTLDPAGTHCPSWDDAFVSSYWIGNFAQEVMISSTLVSLLVSRITQKPLNRLS